MPPVTLHHQKTNKIFLMMEQIQFIQVTPEQLKREILDEVKQEIKSLKEHIQPQAPTEYLTRRQVAQLLNINLTTLANWTKKGVLKAYGVQGRVYYIRKEVEGAVVELKSK